MPNGQQSPYKRNPTQLRKFKVWEGNWSSGRCITHFKGFAHRHKVARMWGKAGYIIRRKKSQ